MNTLLFDNISGGYLNFLLYMDFFCHETNETENGNGTSKGGLSFINKNTSKQLSYQLSTSYLKISFAVK